MYILYLVGGFNPSENISQWEGLSHILWKIKNVPTTNQPNMWDDLELAVKTLS